MSIRPLETFWKQPADVQDYDIDCSEYLDDLADTIQSHEVDPVLGLSIDASTVLSGDKVVKVWISGGLSGQTYRVTLRITTVGGRVKEGEIVLKVKEV